LIGTIPVSTVGALGNVNGQQMLASADQVALIKQHIQTFQSGETDLRAPIRQIEQLLFTKHIGYLIGNQCIDFQKQDGVTEMEEAIIANTIERRLNDLLLQEEEAEHVIIDRRPIFVATVSNFTNFLDLSRKTLRSLELGIPVVVLGRHQTTQQHSYRWTQLLVDLCADAGIHPGMITYLSCALGDIKDITTSCQDMTGNLYVTGSRSLAADIAKTYANTVASTGGPNTLVSTDWASSDEQSVTAVSDAIANSAAIESAGQCTALRHCVIPSSMTDSDCQRVFDRLAPLESAESALKKGQFAGIFSHSATNTPPVPAAASTDLSHPHDSYVKHESVQAFLKIREGQLPEAEMQEYWRQVVVDFTKMDLVQVDTETGKRQVNEAHMKQLTAWLNENQPISLAVNGPRTEAIAVGLKLWERTSLVVNTIGSTDDEEMPPAMTCQARPQDGEIFGEFPPRNAMDQYTTFPVLIPSSNPSYGSWYNEKYLQTKGAALSDYIIKSTKTLLSEIRNDIVRGYCIVLIEYLQNVARGNPKHGRPGASRTVLWGIQRPPLDQKTVIRCGGPTCSWDHIAPIYVLFHATTARDQVELSIDPDNAELIAFCTYHKLRHVVETSDVAMQSARRPDIFHWVSVSGVSTAQRNVWPMAGNFVSLYLPMGHVKSTKANDEEFQLHCLLSSKWLNTLF
jgi:hypothetical protein